MLRLLFFLLFFLPCVTSSAQATYTITEAELTTLETNLSILEKHSNEKEKLLTTQKLELEKAHEELKLALSKINELETLNETTKRLLESAKQSLLEYEKEKTRLKRERNIAYFVATLAVILRR